MIRRPKDELWKIAESNDLHIFPFEGKSGGWLEKVTGEQYRKSM